MRSPKNPAPVAILKNAAMGSELLRQMSSGINAALRDLSTPLGFSEFAHFLEKLCVQTFDSYILYRKQVFKMSLAMRYQLKMAIFFILCSLVGLGYLAFTQETRVRIPAKEVFDGNVII